LKKPHVKAGKRQRLKTQKAGAWSGGKEKTQREEACIKKQECGLGILMEWASASGGRLFLGKR